MPLPGVAVRLLLPSGFGRSAVLMLLSTHDTFEVLATERVRLQSRRVVRPIKCYVSRLFFPVPERNDCCEDDRRVEEGWARQFCERKIHSKGAVPRIRLRSVPDEPQTDAFARKE